MHPHDFSYAIDAFCSCCLFYTFALPYRLNSCYRYQNHLSLALHLSFRRILPELRCFVDTIVRLLIGSPVRFCNFLSSGIKNSRMRLASDRLGFPMICWERLSLIRLYALFAYSVCESFVVSAPRCVMTCDHILSCIKKAPTKVSVFLHLIDNATQ